MPAPRTRKGFKSGLFERYQRRQVQLDEVIAKMFVGEVSASRVGEALETLTGVKPTPSTVSRVHHQLQAEFERWEK